MISQLIEFLRAIALMTMPVFSLCMKVSGILLAVLLAGYLVHLAIKSALALIESIRFEFGSNPVYAMLLLLTGTFCASSLMLMVAQ